MFTESHAMARRLAMMACIGLVAMAACSKAPEKQADALSVPAAPASTAQPPTPPADQTALVAKVEAANGNDEAFKTFCTEFQQTTDFTDWIVTVSDFSTSTVNSSIDIVFDASPHVHLEQVIQTSDPAYAAIAALRMRQSIRVSGRFTHGNSECGYQLRTIGVAISQAQVVG